MMIAEEHERLDEEEEDVLQIRETREQRHEPNEGDRQRSAEAKKQNHEAGEVTGKALYLGCFVTIPRYSPVAAIATAGMMKAAKRMRLDENAYHDVLPNYGT